MKKIVPIILVLALILGFASNALATEITIVSTDPVTATVKQGEDVSITIGLDEALVLGEKEPIQIKYYFDTETLTFKECTLLVDNGYVVPGLTTNYKTNETCAKFTLNYDLTGATYEAGSIATLKFTANSDATQSDDETTSIRFQCTSTSFTQKPTVEITVQKPDVISVTSVKILAEGATMAGLTQTLTVGESKAFTATVLPENATDKTLTWSVVDKSLNPVEDVAEITVDPSDSSKVTVKALKAVTDNTYTLVASSVNGKNGYNGLNIQEAVTPDPEPTAAYTVSLGENQSDLIPGNQVSVPVTVSSDTETAFNAIDVTAEYDSAKLTLDTSNLSGFTVNTADGKVRVKGYGEDKALGTAFTLNFTVKSDAASGDTEVKFTDARVDKAANAIDQNAPQAAYANEGKVTLTIGDKCNVALPAEGFTGDATAERGGSYTFTANDKNYNYTFNATMGGAAVEVTDNGNGTYTIANVTGDIVIEVASKTAKTYTVTITGEDTTGAASATYGTDYSFTVDKKDGYTYTVSAKIGETELKLTTGEDGKTYTIAGSDITGNIAITVDKQVKTPETVNVGFTGSGAEDVTDKVGTTAYGEDFTFTIAPKTNYVYTVEYKVGDSAKKSLTASGNSYTIPGADVTGDLTIIVTRTWNGGGQENVEVYEYVKLSKDGAATAKTAILVLAKGTPTDGNVFTYDGHNMFWSAKYDKYCYLDIVEGSYDLNTIAQNANAKIAQAAAAKTEIGYTGDVNKSADNLIDINDVQLVYDMYNAKYDSFATVTMEKFLSADMNGSKNLTVDDAVAILALDTFKLQ